MSVSFSVFLSSLPSVSTALLLFYLPCRDVELNPHCCLEFVTEVDFFPVFFFLLKCVNVI